MRYSYTLALLLAGLGIYFGYKFFFSYNMLPTKHYSDQEVIQEALKIKLLDCKSSDAKNEIEKITTNISAQVRKADYKMAVKIAMDGLKKFPYDFELQHDFTAILGDYSEHFSGLVQEQMIQKSKESFEKLMLDLDQQPMREKFYFINEYCYRFKLHKKQYENGKDCVAYYQAKHDMITDKGFNGYYFQCVGAVYYAQQLWVQGDIKLAQEWAQKALVAWAQYFTYRNDYYNSYVHYALALGMLGYYDEMMQTLQKSADIIKKDLNYYEFKEVLEFVEKIKSGN